MGSKPLHVKLRDKRNHPPEGEPWVWLTRELIESDAWRTAPINTRRFVERLMIEHMAHAGTENGKLVCTYDDLAKFGVASRHRHAAIADALARGLVDRTEQGKPSTGADRWPSKYARCPGFQCPKVPWEITEIRHSPESEGALGKNAK